MPSSCESIVWPQLLSGDGATRPVDETDAIELTVEGPMVRVELTRRFAAASRDEPVTLRVPLPHDAALAGLTLDTGDGPIEGRLVEVHRGHLLESPDVPPCPTVHLAFDSHGGRPVSVRIALERVPSSDGLALHQWMTTDHSATLRAVVGRGVELRLDGERLDDGDSISLERWPQPRHLALIPAAAPRALRIDPSGSTFFIDPRWARPRRRLDRVVVALDTSASIGRDRLARGVAITRALREQLAPEVALSIVHGDVWSSVCEAPSDACLDTLTSGGASDLGRLLVEAWRQVGPDERAAVILLSDGRPTLGPRTDRGLLRELLREAPRDITLHAVADVDGAAAVVASLVDTWRGEVLHAPDASAGSVAAALRVRISSAEVRVLSIEAVTGELGDVTSLGTRPVWGRIERTPLSVDVTFRVDGEVLTERFEVPALDTTDDTTMSTRFWARTRIAELVEDGGANDALEIAHAHGVTSPWTTFFLEGIEDPRARLVSMSPGDHDASPTPGRVHVGDRDGDGIHDWNDLCVDEPGRIGYGDVSGCPHTRHVVEASSSASDRLRAGRTRTLYFQPDSTEVRAGAQRAFDDTIAEFAAFTRDSDTPKAFAIHAARCDSPTVLDAERTTIVREQLLDAGVPADALLTVADDACPFAPTAVRPHTVDHVYVTVVRDGEHLAGRVTASTIVAALESDAVDSRSVEHVTALVEALLATGREARSVVERWPFDGDLAMRITEAHGVPGLASLVLSDAEALLADNALDAELVELVTTVPQMSRQAGAEQWLVGVCRTGRFALTRCERWFERLGFDAADHLDAFVEPRLRVLQLEGRLVEDDPTLRELQLRRLEASGASPRDVLRLRTESLELGDGSRTDMAEAALIGSTDDACRILDSPRAAVALARRHPRARRGLLDCAVDLWLSTQGEDDVVFWVELDAEHDDIAGSISLDAMLAPARSARRTTSWRAGLSVRRPFGVDTGGFGAFEVTRSRPRHMIWLRALTPRDAVAPPVAFVRGTLHVVRAAGSLEPVERAVPFTLEVGLPADHPEGAAITEVDL